MNRIINRDDRYNENERQSMTGYIRVYNTLTKTMEGVAGVKVKVRQSLRVSYAYTDNNGHYKIPAKYSGDIYYSVIFENITGYKIWSNRLFFAPAKYNLGFHSCNGYNVDIQKDSIAWTWATINNGTYYYCKKFCLEFGIYRPVVNLRIWSIIQTGKWSGSAPMLRQMSYKVINFKDFIISCFVICCSLGISTMLPDIFFLERYSDTRDAYSTIFHELGHASHFSKVGKSYWLKYIEGIIFNKGYGNGKGRNDGYIGIGEMWGNFIGYMCESKYFGEAHLGAENDWYNPNIMVEICKQIKGMTPQKIFSCLQKDIHNHKLLKERLIEQYGDEELFNKIFDL